MLEANGNTAEGQAAKGWVMAEKYQPGLLHNKICLVTGGTAGIGKVTATELASKGAQVVIAGRNSAKTEEVVKEIKSASGNAQVDYLLGDFTDLDQVRELAKTFQARWDRLDVLVNNAGAFINRRQDTVYGVEKTFLVNYLAPFLLTNLLLLTIRASAPARIVNVTSEAEKFGQIDFNDLRFTHGYFGMKAYSRSKLAILVFSYELARRTAGSGVTVNAVHPGHIATDIWKTNFSVFGPLLKWVMSLFALTPEEGADTLIYLASSPDVVDISGKFFVGRQAVASSPQSYDKSLAKQLWEVSENLVANSEII